MYIRHLEQHFLYIYQGQVIANGKINWQFKSKQTAKVALAAGITGLVLPKLKNLQLLPNKVLILKYIHPIVV